MRIFSLQATAVDRCGWCPRIRGSKFGGTFLYRRVNGVFNATIRWYYCSDVFVVSIPTLKKFHFCNDVQWVHIISELFYMLEIKVFVVFRPTLKFPYFMHEWIILYIPKSKGFLSSLHCPFVGKLWHDFGITWLWD